MSIENNTIINLSKSAKQLMMSKDFDSSSDSNDGDSPCFKPPTIISKKSGFSQLFKPSSKDESKISNLVDSLSDVDTDTEAESRQRG